MNGRETFSTSLTAYNEPRREALQELMIVLMKRFVESTSIPMSGYSSDVLFDVCIKNYRYVLMAFAPNDIENSVLFSPDVTMLMSSNGGPDVAESLDSLQTTQQQRRASVLSQRESEIARMIAYGTKNRLIASRLNISVHTVSTHIRRIYTKLNVHSRAEMVHSLFKRRWRKLDV